MRMNKKEITDKIRNLFDKNNRTTLFVIVGLLGILLIFASSFFEDDEEAQQTSGYISQNVNVSEDTEKFKEQTEKELCEMLENISGVGEVKVMITVDGTTEYVYAEELTKDSNDSSQSYKSQYVIVENNGDKEALVKKINKPQISGVAVVCKGGDDVKVAERVIKAVSTVLNISSGKVCVVPLVE